ncbi:hypothetical protein [Microbacterium sp. Ru50]|uniref:hypothetical protein n=1 Tax=Microbacterium sp. Ru50 TaxID=2080744 RepID=UPI0015E23613|nr:hypothetical protein [Microbacterium sp. Ru50]
MRATNGPLVAIGTGVGALALAAVGFVPRRGTPPGGRRAAQERGALVANAASNDR